jgi:hypothetical protein
MVGKRSDMRTRSNTGSPLLTGMRTDEFVYFSAYALAGLVLPFSSFTLLETYGLQLQHLSPHSSTMCCALPGATRGPSVASTSSTGSRACTVHRRLSSRQVGPLEAGLGGDAWGGL